MVTYLEISTATALFPWLAEYPNIEASGKNLSFTHYSMHWDMTSTQPFTPNRYGNQLLTYNMDANGKVVMELEETNFSS